LKIECSILACIYTVSLLIPLMYNVYHYVIGQKRYKLFLTNMFYLISFVIIVARIVSFVTQAV